MGSMRDLIRKEREASMPEMATQVVIALSITLVVWYVAGSWMNRRRASHLLRWIREGVRVFGGEATWRGMGTSGFQVSVKGVKHPFKRIEMMVLLESREMLLLWLFNRLRGQRDLMVFKADLRTRPKAELEIAPKKGRVTRKILKAIEEEAWARGGIEDTDLMLLRKGKEVTSLAEKLAPLLREYAPYIRRLSLRKESPHFLVNLSLPGLEEEPAGEMFSFLRKVIETMASGGTRRKGANF